MVLALVLARVYYRYVRVKDGRKEKKEIKIDSDLVKYDFYVLDTKVLFLTCHKHNKLYLNANYIVSFVRSTLV